MTTETLTVSSLVLQIKRLPRVSIPYPSGKGECRIVDVQPPEGPILFKRRNDTTPWERCKTECISGPLLWRVVNALNTGIPIQIDRVVGASYNCRSVLEAIIAACPNFFICRPNRYAIIAGQVSIKKGHKHLLWKPDQKHELPSPTMLDIQGYISEVPSVDVYFDCVEVPDPITKVAAEQVDPEIKRMHSLMQVALCDCATWLNMRPWVAVEDHGIKYHGKSILELPNMVNDLKNENVISNYPKAIKVAKHVDCLWFNGGLPFAFEVEHSTGVTSGLTRMNALRTQLEFCRTNYIIVAADEARADVLKKAADPQFEDMPLGFLPYSAVTEFHAFTKRHPNRGNVKKEFVLTFVEEFNKA